jgi:hypothetical protein
MQTTRRTFIRQAACAALTTTGILNTIFDLRRLSAAPLDASGYKALFFTAATTRTTSSSRTTLAVMLPMPRRVASWPYRRLLSFR